MKKKFAAVIFDLDGVITDTAEYHYLAWKQLGESLNIDIDREFNETLKGISRMDSLEKILEFGNRQMDFTLMEKEALAAQKNRHYMNLISGITPDDLLPGIYELLPQLKEAGYKLAIASASKNALAVTHALGVQSFFDHIVDAATVKNSKPNPEVFLKAAKAIGVRPEKCIGIEDSVAGVIAINESKMFSVAIGTDIRLRQANIVLASTKELTMEVIRNENLHQ